MARPERRIDGDSEGDALAQFALELRELRARAGNLGYRELARRALYSASTLSEAAAGRRLPTLEVTLAYVRACGGDLEVWEKRWRRLAVDLATPEPETAADSSPYLGLSTFGREDAERFFGRERLVQELLARLSRRRFLAVFGPSGSGKSSLLRAGLMSAWARAEPGGSPQRIAVLLTPGEDPLRECAVQLAGLLGVAAGALHADLAADPGNLDLTIRQILADRPAEAELLLVVDQFEEIFTLCGDADRRQAFAAALLAATGSAASRARVVAGIRADFYGRCAELPALVEAMQDAQVLVGSMTAEELRAAITQPAIRAGLTVESTLVSTIIAEMIGRPGALPLMSHALLETWQRRRGTVLTLAGYQAAGGIDGALARSAEHTYTSLDSDQQRAARQILLRLTTLGDGAEDTRRRLRRGALDENAAATDVVHQLAQARLLTLGDDMVEITHEALIRSWPRLRAWLDEDRDGLRLQQQLTDAAAAWHAEQRDPGLLYRGSRLAAAHEWLDNHRGEITISGQVREFLATSARHQRRAKNLRRAAVATVAAFALLATGAAIFAFQQRATAQAQRDSAVFNQLSGEADRLRATDVSLAAQLDLVAHRLRPADQKIYADLITSENLPLSAPLLGHADAVHSVAFSPNGRVLASASTDRTIRLWNVADPAHAASWSPLPASGAVDAVTFSPDGRVLASAGADGTIRLWNVADPAHAAPIGAPLFQTGAATSVAFSPDGRVLASASAGGAIRLWNVANPADPVPFGQPLTGQGGAVTAVAFSPDGRTLASAGDDATVRLWNVTDPAHAAPLGTPLTGHAKAVTAVAFSPDGRTLASASRDTTIRLWNVADPAHAAPFGGPLAGHASTVESVAFSPDSRQLASGSADSTVRLWDVANPANPTKVSAPDEPLSGHVGSVLAVAFSPRGDTLASAGADHAVRLWNIPRTMLTTHLGTVETAAFSPRGRLLATAGADHTVQLWNVANPADPLPLGRPLTGHTGTVLLVAFSPDGKVLASGGTDGTVRLWNVADPEHPAPLGPPLAGHGGLVSSVAFSPNGHILAGASGDHTVRLWDMTDPAHAAPLGRPLVGHTDVLESVAFSPDGHILASAGDDGTIRLWNVANPADPAPLGQPLTGHTGGVFAVAFSPDGRTLASAGNDATLRLWDVANPAHPTAIGQPLTGHSSGVFAIAFSPNGHTLASASNDTTVRLWNVTDPAHPTLIGQPLTGHSNTVLAAAFSPDGTILATGGADDTVRLWTLDADQAVQRICATTVGALTPETWRQYVSDQLPFDPPCGALAVRH